MRRYSHVGVPHVTYGRPPTFDGDAQQEGDDQGSSASSSVVLAYISHPTVYLLSHYHPHHPPRGGPGASSFTSRGGGSTHARRRMVHGVDSLTRCPCHVHMCTIPYTVQLHTNTKMQKNVFY